MKLALMLAAIAGTTILAAGEFRIDLISMKSNIDLEIRETSGKFKIIDSPWYKEKRKQSVVGKNVFYPSVWHENKSGNISVLDYSCALRTGASYNYLLVNGVRRFTSRELLRLQGFPDTYKIVVSNQEIRRQTGNSVAVPMIREVAKEMDALLKEGMDNANKTEIA